MNRIACPGFAFGVLFLALIALFTPRRVTPSHQPAASAAAPRLAREPVDMPREAPPTDFDVMADDVDATIDLYGNDVSPAVATYSLDSLGSLYEVHSPQTELPRLGSPKT